MAGPRVVEEQIQLPRDPRRERHQRIEEAWLGVVPILAPSRNSQGEEQRAYCQNAKGTATTYPSDLRKHCGSVLYTGDTMTDQQLKVRVFSSPT
jgi:hypothetical protein